MNDWDSFAFCSEQVPVDIMDNILKTYLKAYLQQWAVQESRSIFSLPGSPKNFDGCECGLGKCLGSVVPPDLKFNGITVPTAQ